MEAKMEKRYCVAVNGDHGNLHGNYAVRAHAEILAHELGAGSQVMEFDTWLPSAPMREEEVGKAACPSCSGGNNSAELGGTVACFHCTDCGYVHCVETSPAPNALTIEGTGEKLPEVLTSSEQFVYLQIADKTPEDRTWFEGYFKKYADLYLAALKENADLRKILDEKETFINAQEDELNEKQSERNAAVSRAEKAVAEIARWKISANEYKGLFLVVQAELAELRGK